MALAEHLGSIDETYEEIEDFLLRHIADRPGVKVGLSNLAAAAGIMGGLSNIDDVIAVVALRLRNRHRALVGVIEVPALTKGRREAMMQHGIDPMTGEVLWTS